ncbi:MAG: hypothetical protein ACK4YF_06055 [Exilispira sp.]
MDEKPEETKVIENIKIRIIDILDKFGLNKLNVFGLKLFFILYIL